ncbi:uncharacterized protein LOC129307379 [Prosopis cineraria]|uniref:uncharacterized protein LOC129307379 n=1 Tax=Prosopis cineraria TaxID=364024 RepID=UPI00240FA076|nr:uncharacterized protein LOC129307379 [Prosopis cineraria]
MISDHTMMTTATTDQWTMQFYDQSPDHDDDINNLLQVSAMEGLISDANTIVTTTTSSSSSPSPTSPKAVNGSRPIRRRSRASKRTPTTLLNASTTNFRALVQQFTGCPSSTAMSFEVYKGPITLNFQQGRRQVVHHNTSRKVTTTLPFVNTGFSTDVHHQHLQHQQQQQLADQQQWRLQQDHHHHQQQQQTGDDNLFEYNSGTDLFSSSINSSKPSMERSDELIVDHNYSLHDLTMNNDFFSNNNDVIQNGSYFM